jgi:hypothetical protein
MYNPPHAAAAVITAKIIPIGWTYALATRFPLANQAKLVVIPQLGQGSLVF